MKVLFSKCTDAIECANNRYGFGCFYSTAGDANLDIHLHECCEILFCLSGGKSFFINDRIYEVTPGNIFIMNQFEAHKITFVNDVKFERFVLQLHPSYIYDHSTPESNLAHCFDVRGDNISNRLILTDEEKEKMYRIFNKLTVEHNFGDDILKNNAVLEILVNINRLFMKKNKNYTYHSIFNNKTLINALNYINKNFSEEISINDIAKNCFVSTSTLNGLFKKYLGTTAAKYITSKRMTKAKHLLLSGISVSDTAEKCGYADYTSFIRAFKKATGTSPGHYK